MPSALSVEVIGLDRLLRKLDVSRLGGHVRPMFSRIITLVEGNERRETPRDTGAGARGWQNRLEGQGLDLTGRVFNPLMYIAVQNIGRTPGARPPPPQALAGWARRHGFAGSLFVLARAIGEKGKLGRLAQRNVGFVQRGLERSRQGINGIVNQAAQAIERGFGGR